MKHKTEIELFRDHITPQIGDIVRRYGGYREGFDRELNTVLFALARYCFSLGHGFGYDEGHDDAKHGRDQRISPNDIHLN